MTTVSMKDGVIIMLSLDLDEVVRRLRAAESFACFEQHESPGGKICIASANVLYVKEGV